MAELEAKNAELKSKCLGKKRAGGRSYGEQPPQRSAEFCGDMLPLQDEIARKDNNCSGFENTLVSCLMMLVFLHLRLVIDEKQAECTHLLEKRTSHFEAFV